MNARPAAILACFALFTSPAPAFAGVALHKALYGLSMVSVQSGAGIVGLRGEMYFEQADACDAWTTDQRFTMEYQYPERSPVNNTNHYVAWEAKDGSRFSFNSERQEDGQPVELLRGGALRAETGGAASYTRPAGLAYALSPGFLLPVAHMEEVARRARAGEKIFTAVLFDGTDADGPASVTAVIGPQLSAAEAAKPEGPGIDKTLLAPEAWPVRMAVFPLKDKDSLLPAYEMDMILHANGVISHAVIDYRTFRVEQTLKTLEKVPPPQCG